MSNQSRWRIKSYLRYLIWQKIKTFMTSNFPLVNQDELELRANSWHFFTRVHAWCYVLNKGPCMMPHCSPLGWQSHDIHLGKQLQLQGVYFWGQFKAIQLQQEFLENFKSVAQSGRVCQVKGINQSHEQWASFRSTVAPWQNLMAFDKDGDIDWILISTMDDKYFEDVVTDINSAVLLHRMYNKNEECYWETNNRTAWIIQSDFFIREEWRQEYLCSFVCFPLKFKGELRQIFTRVLIARGPRVL